MPGTPNNREVLAQAMATPFVSSFVGRAHTGDLFDTNPERRAAAWAAWALKNLTEVSTGQRSYLAILLSGSHFYDPTGSFANPKDGTPMLLPHLEVPKWVLSRPSPEFPDRLSMAGNGILFPSWLVAEVVAIRRSLFNTESGPIGEVVDTLNSRRAHLHDGVVGLTQVAAPRWASFERLLSTTPDGLSQEATGEFTPEEVTEYIPALSEYSVHIVFDEKLKETAKSRSSRRVGIWQLHGETPGGDKFSFAVVTPRLTSNSMFKDELFYPAKESSAALLLRGLILRRLLSKHVGPNRASAFTVGDPDPVYDNTKIPGHIRSIPAKVGHPIPKARPKAAVYFVQMYPDGDAAWNALQEWAGSDRLLALSKGDFLRAHRNTARSIRQAEDPRQEDIDILLPLAWDDLHPVRLTFSHDPNK